MKMKAKSQNEKYYICPNCKDLKTESEILNGIGNGSCGMCYCEFDNGRILIKYKRISKQKWIDLKNKKLK